MGFTVSQGAIWLSSGIRQSIVEIIRLRGVDRLNHAIIMLIIIIIKMLREQMRPEGMIMWLVILAQKTRPAVHPVRQSGRSLHSGWEQQG